MIPRFIHKWWAHLCGFFWLPCPVCGREFGGHQVQAWGHSYMVEGGSWRATCPDCPVEYQPIADGGWVVKSPGFRPGFTAATAERWHQGVDA